MELWQKSRDNNWEERKRIWFEKAEELVRESLRERELKIEKKVAKIEIYRRTRLNYNDKN